MQINVKGVWWGCKYGILAMRKNKADPEKGLAPGGSIINTASFVAIMGAATPQIACTCDCTCSKRWNVDQSYHTQILLQRLVHELTKGSQNRLGCLCTGCRSRDDQRTCDGPCPRGHPFQLHLPVSPSETRPRRNNAHRFAVALLRLVRPRDPHPDHSPLMVFPFSPVDGFP